MVKGEHVRPLLGFAVVCVTAALILGTGMTTPSAIRQFVEQQRVLPAPMISDTLLGMTLDRLTGRSASSRTNDPGEDARDSAVAQERASLLVASFPRVAQAQATLAEPTRTRHHPRVRHPGKSHAKPTATSATPPPAQPLKPAQPTKPEPPTAAGGHAAGWADGGPVTHTLHGLGGRNSHGVGPSAGFHHDRSRHVQHGWHRGPASTVSTRRPGHAPAQLRSEDRGPRGQGRGHAWGHGRGHDGGHGWGHGWGHHGGGHGPGDRSHGRHR